LSWDWILPLLSIWGSSDAQRTVFEKIESVANHPTARKTAVEKKMERNLSLVRSVELTSRALTEKRTNDGRMVSASDRQLLRDGSEKSKRTLGGAEFDLSGEG
jgi:hypothetical protein